MEVAIYGIRHHGPGSARRLLKALRTWQPDCLLVEVPADAESLVPYAADNGMKPPVAILIFDPRDFNRAIYLPFAHFSPEWQAIRYGLKEEIPVRFMDLPMSTHFGVQAAEGQQQEFAQDASKDMLAWRLDPLGQFARLAGYEDGERWWEVTFEHQLEETSVFEAVGEMMRYLREETREVETTENLRREAHMRKVLRKAIKDGFERIAVVCGAWHQPAIEQWDQIKASADNKILKGLTKVKTQATWVPWSYDRLSRGSGYRSGVHSPAWYELLYKNRQDAVINWMVKAARLLRQQDLQASSASVIHAVGLARALASLRKLQLPGLEELREAGMSVFGHGDAAVLKLIDEKLVVGDVLGKVPKTIPLVPIQKDLESQIKSARLTRYRNTTDKVTKALDLRVEANLKASRLLHRLHILGIYWGELLAENENQLGTFTERWRLKWKPDFIIRVIEAGMWGQTVQEATLAKMQQKVSETEKLPRATSLVEQAMHAGLDEILDELLLRLEQLAAQTKDVFALMDAFPSMVNVFRYGDTRQTNTESIERVIHHVFPRVCIGLLPASISIQEEVAEDLFEKILAVNRALGVLQEPALVADWDKALKGLVTNVAVQPLLKGACTRLLFDKGRLTESETAVFLDYGLSRGQPAVSSMYWLQGFLHGSGLVLLYNPALWEVLDRFVAGLPLEDLYDCLPLFRKAIAHYSAAERQKIFQLVLHGPPQQEQTDPFDAERKEAVVPVLKQLLGLGGD